VVTAGDGSEAMTLLERGAPRFDLMLSDVMMPGHTGPALAARLDVLRPGTPVLLMTGYAEDQLDELIDPSAKWRVITKPFSGSTLTQKITEVLRQASVHPEHAMTPATAADRQSMSAS
jgi:two-component system, cell cycle sensor histidine kinase and response regulator CckA